MISEILNVLEKIDENDILDFILNNYEIPTGLYFLISEENMIIYHYSIKEYKKDGNKYTKEIWESCICDNKTNINCIDLNKDFFEVSKKEIKKIKLKFFYSNYLCTNKALKNKKLFNNNYLSLILKKESINILTNIDENIENVTNYYNEKENIKIQFENKYQFNIKDFKEYTKKIKDYNNILENKYKDIFKKYFDKISIICNNLNINKSEKYIGIFIDEVEKEYKNQFNRYLSIALLDKKTLNFQHQIYSSSFFSHVNNDKKPCLKSSTRKNQLQCDYIFKDLLLLFYFEKMCQILPNQFYIQYDNEDIFCLDDFIVSFSDITKNSCYVINKTDIKKTIHITDFYNISEIDNHIKNNDYNLKNFLNNDILTDDTFNLFEKINSLFDNKLKYNLLNSNLQNVVIFDYNKVLWNILYKNKNVIFNYFFKKRDKKYIKDFKVFVNNDLVKVFKERQKYFFYNQNYKSKWSYCIKNDLIIYLNILNLFEENRSYLMKIEDIKNKIKNDIENKNYSDMLNYEEFLYIIGMLIQILSKQAITENAQKDILKNVLSLNSIDKIVSYLNRLNNKYSYNIKASLRYNNLFRLVQEFYYSNKENLPKFDETLFLCGFYSDLFYTKTNIDNN